MSRLRLAIGLVLWCVSCASSAAAPASQAASQAGPLTTSSQGVAAEQAATTPDAPRSVLIGRKPLAVGMLAEEVERRSMALDFSSPGSYTKLDRTEHRTKRSEVLEVNGRVITKLLVHYTVHRVDSRVNDQQQPSDVPIVEGERFLIARRGDDVVVSAPDGSPLDEAKRAFVADDFKRFGRPKGFDTFPPRPLVVGERIEELEAAFTEDVSTNTSTASNVRVRLIDVRDGDDGEVAVIEARFDVMEATSQLESHFKFICDIRVRDGLPLSAQMSGPLALSSGTSSGGGNLVMTSEWTYFKPGSAAREPTAPSDP